MQPTPKAAAIFAISESAVTSDLDCKWEKKFVSGEWGISKCLEVSAEVCITSEVMSQSLFHIELKHFFGQQFRLCCRS